MSGGRGTLGRPTSNSLEEGEENEGNTYVFILNQMNLLSYLWLKQKLDINGLKVKIKLVYLLHFFNF